MRNFKTLAAIIVAAAAFSAAPAAAMAANCSPTAVCEGGAQLSNPNFGVSADIDGEGLNSSDPSKYMMASTVYVTNSSGTYTIITGIAYGSPYSFGANNDFFIRSVGPNGSNTYWYPSANWQPYTYYAAKIEYIGTNQWQVYDGPFSKVIANNGLAGPASLLGAAFLDTDPCLMAGANQSAIVWWDDIGGGSYLTSGLPSWTLFHSATHGTYTQWMNNYNWVGDGQSAGC